MFAASKSGQSASTIDPYYSYVPLLLQTGSASARSTVVADSSTNNFTVTRVSNPSTGWVSPYQTDGYWGNYFNGSTDILTVSSNAALGFGTGDFTVEFWIHPLVTANTWSIYHGTATNAFIINTSSTGQVIARSYGVADLLTTTATLAVNAWTHLAVTRSGTTLTIWLNGVSSGTVTNSTSFATTGLYIGRADSATALVNGYLSNLRVVKGTAVYTGAFTPPTSPLTAITNTVFLTCQSNRFKDNSTNNFAITLTGTPQTTPYFYPSGFTAPAASPGAALFNGSTQFLKSTTATTAFQFGSDPFTVECWLYQPSRPARQYICGGLFSGVGFQIFMDSPGFIRCSATTVGDLPAATIAVPLNAWTHIAVVRTSTSAGGVVYYINGVPAGANTMSANISGTASYINVGTSADSTAEPTNGYIGNFRAVKGIAVYTGAFIPPSGALTQTGGTYPSTTNVNTSIPNANTSLLLNLADSNYNSATDGVQNNTFIDTSNYAFPITRNGTPTQGSVTPYWPNGQWSNYFNGSTDYLTFNFATGSNITGDFTWECWAYDTGATIYGTLLGWRPTGAGWSGFIIQRNTNNNVIVNIATPTVSTITQTSNTYITNQWNHVALVRSSSTVTLYVNGVNAGTTTVSGAFNPGSAYWIGSDPGNNIGSVRMGGYISNQRFVNGTAVYTGNFTPPTTPLTAITNTALLTCQSNRFRDNSTNNFSITTSGTPQVQAFQPFSPTASYTAAAYGGSGYFGTSGDSAVPPQSSVFNLSIGNWTIEAWFYSQSLGGGSARYITVTPSSGNVFGLIPGGTSSAFSINQFGTANVLTSSVAPTLYAWQHIAIVKNSSTTSVYLNGVSIMSGTVSWVNASTTIFFGSNTGSFAFDYFGYISNARVVTGTAVYTSNFTLPTAPVTAIANTSLLLNFTNAAIYDAAVQNNATTVGNTQASTTVSKWSPTSTKFNGSGDYLSIPASPSFAFGTGDLTIECWFYHSAAQGIAANIICVTNGSAFGIIIHNNLTPYPNVVTFWCDTYSLSTPGITGTTTLAIGNWYHFALTRSSGVWRMYINGIQQGSNYTNAASPDRGAGYNLRIGGDNFNANRVFNGYIQDVRITKGYARTITASPTAPFQMR